MASDPAQGIAGRRIGLVLGTSTGGIGRHVRGLVAGLQSRGAEVTVCAPAAVDARFAFSATGAMFMPVSIGKGWRFFDPRTVRRMRAVLATVELVHAHGLRPSIAATAARRHAQPLVVTWHNAVLGSALHRRALARGERTVARHADLLLGASQDLVARAGQLGARDARLTMLPAPSLAPLTGARDEIRAALGVGDATVVLTVARLVPQKRLDVLVRAIASLDRAGVNVRALIVGSGRLHEDLLRQIRAANAPVQLLGERSDVTDLLTAADVFALSSEWEARSFAVQEAMWSGCVVVVPSVGGLPDLVCDTGLVVGPDAPALAAGIKRLVDNPAERTRLAAAARARARTWPDEATVIDGTIEAYLALLGRGAGPG